METCRRSWTDDREVTERGLPYCAANRLIYIYTWHCIWLYCQEGQTWCQSIAHYVANIPIRNTMETFEQGLPFQMGVQKLYLTYYKHRKNLSSIRSPPHCSAGSARYSPHSAHIDTRRASRNILSIWAAHTVYYIERCRHARLTVETLVRNTLGLLLRRSLTMWKQPL